MKWQHRQCGMRTGSFSFCQTTQQATSSNLMLPCTALALSLSSLAGARHQGLYICAYQYILHVAHTHDLILTYSALFSCNEAACPPNRQHVFYWELTLALSCSKKGNLVDNMTSCVWSAVDGLSCHHVGTCRGPLTVLANQGIM